MFAQRPERLRSRFPLGRFLVFTRCTPRISVAASLEDTLRARLHRLDDAKLRRSQRVVTADPTRVLCSNDYLGLAGDRSLIAPTDALDAAALHAAHLSGSGASRLVSGTHPAHAALEADLATWLEREAAIYFATGYQANVGLMSALAQKDDVIFSDALNHASIIDGIRLSSARRVIFPHLDMDALDHLLATTPCDGLKIIVTDAIFSMDGDAAKLRSLVRLKHKYNAVLIVDEAHAFGVLGAQGRGLVDHVGVREDVDAVVGPCGKSFGTTGAFVAGSALLREWLYNRARSFVFSTAPPPYSAELTRRAIPILQAGVRQAELNARMQYFAGLLDGLGFWEGAPISPIFPVVVGSEENAVALAQALDHEGIFVHPIRPPTVPAGTSRLRVTVTAATPYAILDRFADVLAQECRRLSIRPLRWSHGNLES